MKEAWPGRVLKDNVLLFGASNRATQKMIKRKYTMALIDHQLWQVWAYDSRDPARHSTYILYFLVLYRQYSTRNFFLLEVMCKGSPVP
jgi:hypothetical protein